MQQAMERAEQEVQRQNVKKNIIAMEKRQVKEQKNQAENHLLLEKQLKDLKKLHFQWRSYHNSKVQTLLKGKSLRETRTKKNGRCQLCMISFSVVLRGLLL